MTLHWKCATFLVILCTMTVTRCSGSHTMGNDVSEDSDEDEKLKQALFLVDLLKNEYVKALRENHQLRKGTTLTEEPTCATADETITMSKSTTTTAVPSTTAEGAPATLTVDTPIPVEAPVRVNQLGSGRRTGGVTSHPFQQFSGKKDFRRQESDNSSSNTATTLLDTTDTETENVADVTETEAESEAETMTETEAETTLASTALPDATPTDEPTKQDPVQSQVASELIKELKATLIANTRKIHKTPTTIAYKPNKYLKLIKPTLKIHLGGSTRFPIPLPENHAFCYTNPRNRLCRTAI